MNDQPVEDVEWSRLVLPDQGLNDPSIWDHDTVLLRVHGDHVDWRPLPVTVKAGEKLHIDSFALYWGEEP